MRSHGSKREKLEVTGKRGRNPGVTVKRGRKPLPTTEGSPRKMQWITTEDETAKEIWSPHQSVPEVMLKDRRYKAQAFTLYRKHAQQLTVHQTDP